MNIAPKTTSLDFSYNFNNSSIL